MGGVLEKKKYIPQWWVIEGWGGGEVGLTVPDS